MSSGSDARTDPEELVRQVAYYRERNEALASTLLQTDAALSSQRHELEQKRRGFSLLARLTEAMSTAGDDELQAFRDAGAEINPALAMQRTIVLVPQDDGRFRPAVVFGYQQEQVTELGTQSRELPAQLLQPDAPAVLTKAVDDPSLAPIAEWLDVPYFVAAPVVVEHNVEAVLVTGRTLERNPFMPRLDHGDAETVQAIATFLATLVYQKRVYELRTIVNHDVLTGLPNRRLVRNRLLHAMVLARREHCQVAVLYLDLDGFKEINDTMGHAVGDAALRNIARRLEGCTRETDTVGRIGGDEFLVVLPAVAHAQAATRVADDMLATLAHPVRWRDTELQVGVSIGIALYPDHVPARLDDEAVEADLLIRRADEAMYQSKSNGRNRYCFARPPTAEAPGKR